MFCIFPASDRLNNICCRLKPHQAREGNAPTVPTVFGSRSTPAASRGSHKARQRLHAADSSLLRWCCLLLILDSGINCRDANTDCLQGKQEIKKGNKWTVIVWRSACWGDCLNGVRHAENVSISARTNSKPCNN